MRPKSMNTLGYRFCGLLLLACLSATSVAARGERLPSSTSVPAKYSVAKAFLDTVKWPQEPTDAFDANKAPHWDLKNLMPFVSESGVDFSDVNDGSHVHISKKKIEKELSNRSGLAFKGFAHLSSIYSIPYPQYSELTFEDIPNGFKVNMSGWYVFTFTYQDNKPFLTSIDYMEQEGD